MHLFPTVNNALDGLVNDNDLRWLGKELFHSTCSRLLLHVVSGVGCDGSDEGLHLDDAVLKVLPDQARALKAIHLRHVDIHKDKLKGTLFSVALDDSVKGKLAIECSLRDRVRVVSLDQVLKQDQVEHLVINEKNFDIPRILDLRNVTHVELHGAEVDFIRNSAIP